MAVWAFKSQNFEKVYKIKLKNHVILRPLRLTSSGRYVQLKNCTKSAARTEAKKSCRKH